MTSINEMFSVPTETLGESIVHYVASHAQRNIFSMEEELWPMLHDWIVGAGHKPGDETIFGSQRSEHTLSRLAAVEAISDQFYAGVCAAQAVDAVIARMVCFADYAPCLHMIADAARGFHTKVSARDLIFMAEDYCLVGNAAQGAIKNGGAA